MRPFAAAAFSALSMCIVALQGCGGGGDDPPPGQRTPPVSTGVPLAWDQAQATWDNVDWQ